MSDMSHREGEALSTEKSMLPRSIESRGDGVPVMKIGLNDPHTKSVVMSTTEFSADELKEPVLPKTRRIKKKKRNGASKPP